MELSGEGPPLYDKKGKLESIDCWEKTSMCKRIATYPKVGRNVRRYHAIDIAIEDFILVETVFVSFTQNLQQAYSLAVANSRSLIGPQHCLGINSHLQPRDDAQKAQGRRGSKPLVVGLILDHRPDVA